MNLADMTARGLNGQSITREEALEILRSDDSELLSIVAAAGKVRRHFFDNRVRLNYLVNLKSGLCPEDCFYCSQRLNSTAGILRYTWLNTEEAVTARLREVRRLPDGRFDIQTQGERRFRLLEVDATADAPDGRTVRLAAVCVLEFLAGLAEREAATW